MINQPMPHSHKALQRHIDALLQIIVDSTDPIERMVAREVFIQLIWATRKTRGANTPAVGVRQAAKKIREDLKLSLVFPDK